MKTLLSIILRITVSAAILLSFTQCQDLKEAKIRRFLLAEVDKINEDCPQQLNAEIRLDSCKVAEPITLKTYATMINVNAKYYNSDSFYKITQPNLVYAIQTNEDLKQAKDYGVTFTYVYYDAYGKLMSEIIITPEDYNQPIDHNKGGALNSIEKDGVEITLQKLIESTKLALPMQIDEITTLTNVELQADNTLSYICMVNIEKKDMNEHFEENLKLALHNQVNYNEEIKTLLKAKATIKYLYVDKNNEKLCEIILTEDILK